mgnify:FL=1
MIKLSVFASGSGTNAEKIYEYFKGNDLVKIDTVVVSNPNAGILQRSKNWGADVIILDKKEFKSTNNLAQELQKRETKLIILAGFLWLIPTSLTSAFPNKIINIHPSLLPKYGGKGMYGAKVHQAVFDAKEKESGITIHFVNEEYDKGAIILQRSCEVQGLNPTEIAHEVQKLEHKYFPIIVEELIKNPQ